jgi:hypothetical protein
MATNNTVFNPYNTTNPPNRHRVASPNTTGSVSDSSRSVSSPTSSGVSSDSNIAQNYDGNSNGSNANSFVVVPRVGTGFASTHSKSTTNGPSNNTEMVRPAPSLDTGRSDFYALDDGDEAASNSFD